MDLRDRNKWLICSSVTVKSCGISGHPSDDIDSREKDNASRLLTANCANGWWACEFYTNCRKVCPKGVPPNLAIGKARKLLQDMGKKPDRQKK